jgi:hypothetical protein
MQWMCKHIENSMFFNGHFVPEMISTHYVWPRDEKTCASIKVGSQFFGAYGG